MASPKCALLLLLLAAAVSAQDPQYDPNPHYSYSYAVADPVTGDTKNQQEARDGDVVRGSYSVVEPDGNLRVVDYAADPVSGFTASVRRGPAGSVAAPARVAPVVAPVAPVVAPVAPVIPAPGQIYNPYYSRSPYNRGALGYPGYSGYPGYTGYTGYRGYPGYTGYPGVAY
ncbi:larval cuticle protein A2B-like [Bacillus rossius redtenbacheri]|uniref:larval cuticle protein A2B-like n=1 Tax=Bacillus rossius redtenbacheri TaxID=93214 RepID=UPI002FDE7B4A